MLLVLDDLRPLCHAVAGRGLNHSSFWNVSQVWDLYLCKTPGCAGIALLGSVPWVPTEPPFCAVRPQLSFCFGAFVKVNSHHDHGFKNSKCFILTWFYDASNKIGNTAGLVRAWKWSKIRVDTEALFFMPYQDQESVQVGSKVWPLWGVRFTTRARKALLCDGTSSEHVLE